jgi:hypothetical protein
MLRNNSTQASAKRLIQGEERRVRKTPTKVPTLTATHQADSATAKVQPQA